MPKQENRIAPTVKSSGATSILPPQAQADQALAEHADSIRKLGSRVIADAIEIGRRLSECKQIVGHGNWLPWLKREFRWSERTARNFISVYEFVRRKSANLADLAIDISSVYLLAAPSTPDQAREAVLSRLESGEALSLAEVKRAVSKARERKVDRGKRYQITMRMIKGYNSEFCALSSVARAKILQERPENLEIAIHDAFVRQRWAAPHRELQDLLDAIEITAKRPMKTIIAAIPVEHLDIVLKRVASAKRFLTEIDAELQFHATRSLGHNFREHAK
jgi:hypothetical protein